MLQHFLNPVVSHSRTRPNLRIRAGGFDAMQRALVTSSDPWAICERSIITRKA